MLHEPTDHPAVVKRQAKPPAPPKQRFAKLDLRLLQWPQRGEILELFREAQKVAR